MAATSSGLTTSIRRKLQDGRTPEEVIQELVAGGLSELSAQRFVDRAIAEDATAAPLPPLPQPVGSIDEFLAARKAVTQKTTGQKQLIAGSLLIMSGMAVTFISYMMVGPGERYTLMWGPIVFGGLLILHSLNTASSNLRTYPWLTFAGAVGAPAALAAVMFVVLMFTAPTPEEVLEMQVAHLLAEADKAPKDAAAAPAAAAAPVEAPLSPEDAGIARAINQLSQAKSAMGQCDAATALAKVAKASASDVAYDALAQASGDATSDAVKVCLIGAIVELGHEDAGLDVYGEWSRGDNATLRRAAISGFGALGPDFGQPGLPFLGEQLKSPNWDTRFLVVTSLAKLGRPGESLLRSAGADTDARVRETAQAALKNTR